MDNNFFDYIEIAKSLALKASRKNFNFRHGAVLVKNGKELSRGHNKRSLINEAKKAEGILNTNLCIEGMSIIHAEVDCFTQLNFNQKKIRNSLLFLYAESPAKNSHKARPCPNCLKLCQFLGIRKIIYSNKNNTITIEEI
jgi:deoxycytidylate deaminase